MITEKNNVGPGSVGFSDYLDKLHANKTLIFQRILSILESMPQNFANYFMYKGIIALFFKISRGKEIKPSEDSSLDEYMEEK
jgi:hypothetical protein